MAQTVDKYIETFELLDKFSAPLDRIGKKVETFDKKMRGVKRAAGMVQGALSGAIGTVAGIGAAVTLLGVDAVKTAASFEQFAVTLEVLTGSAEKAQKKLEFIKKLAIPSTFTFSQLAEAGTQLEAFRVPLEKALPLIAKLGGAFPKKDLQDFVQLFGRLASGDFPDLEALSGAGLSKLDFMKQGIKFDGQGSLLSSTRDTMNALERIINQRYGNILDRIANTTNSKLASAADKWEEVLRKIGDALIKYVNPALEKLTIWLDTVAESKGFDTLLKKMGKLASAMTGLAFGVMAAWLAVLAIIQGAMGNVAGGIVLLLGSIAAALAGVYAAKKVGNFFDDLGKMGSGHFADKDRFPGSFGSPVPATPAGMEFPDNPALKTLNDIEKNTAGTMENTRQAVDLRKYAFGGGDMAAQGIQSIDLYRGRSRRGADTVRVDVSGARDQLSQAMAKTFEQMLRQYLAHQSGRR